MRRLYAKGEQEAKKMAAGDPDTGEVRTTMKMGAPIHADTELGAKDLLNNRMAYVAVSRGAYDAQIITKDREKLGAALGHEVSHSSAHEPKMKPDQKEEQAVTEQREIAPKQEQGEDFGLCL
jgi:hypothetical protein